MIIRQAKRVVAIGFGVAMLLIGFALFFLPGPGIVLVGIGLAILSSHFVWARWLLKRVQKSAEAAKDSILGKSGEKKQPGEGTECATELPAASDCDDETTAPPGSNREP